MFSSVSVERKATRDESGPRNDQHGGNEDNMTVQPEMLEIPSDVIDRVTSALNIAIALAVRFEPSLAKGITDAALELDEAVNDSLATEA